MRFDCAPRHLPSHFATLRGPWWRAVPGKTLDSTGPTIFHVFSRLPNKCQHGSHLRGNSFLREDLQHRPGGRCRDLRVYLIRIDFKKRLQLVDGIPFLLEPLCDRHFLDAFTEQRNKNLCCHLFSKSSYQLTVISDQSSVSSLSDFVK
jgi:hypothetical protein